MDNTHHDISSDLLTHLLEGLRHENAEMMEGVRHIFPKIKIPRKAQGPIDQVGKSPLAPPHDQVVCGTPAVPIDLNIGQSPPPSRLLFEVAFSDDDEEAVYVLCRQLTKPPLTPLRIKVPLADPLTPIQFRVPPHRQRAKQEQAYLEFMANDSNERREVGDLLPIGREFFKEIEKISVSIGLEMRF
ncbi:hypothetical protein PHJA_001441800 [Phtheirospermum japonicum]|uniref:Uncharacterized protein n=1 Tax=Phtheirospermum japonicum TaxID=374723 RepID=A0A830CCL6_9LAMI|nr:hypothetical protein PHJA_001441800 [Phtheirospermum japonicum]